MTADAFDPEEIPTQTDLTPPPLPRTESEHWRADFEHRLSALEQDLALCVYYCRELARVHLSAEAIARIEASIRRGKRT